MTNFEMYVMGMKADKKSEKTIDVYSKTIKEMISIINKPESDIKYLDLKMWQAKISDASSATVARKISTIKSYFGFLFDSELIEANPSLKLKSPHIVNKEKDYVPYEEAIEMVNCGKNNRDKAIIATYLSTGLRVAELCSITLDQYLNDSIVLKTKGNKFRTVYLNDDCKKYINNYLVDRKDGCDKLFVSNQRTEMNPTALSRTLKVIAERAGINKDVCNHTLRHSHVSYMVDNYGIKAAQEEIGHSNISVTSRYAHSRENATKNMMQSMTL